ncbi:sortase [Candidatus Saccharibacteria bacterium]|nr:sortase [Candidatus Saccharibacteria bacterium]
MDNEGGMKIKVDDSTPEERQRQTAADIARKKVMASYKKIPVKTEVDNEDWQRYHTAWQQYYQKYYSEYYAKAASQYIEKEKLKRQRKLADQEREEGSASLGNISPDKVEVEDSFKARIQKIAKKEQKHKIKRKWIPIIAGVGVTLLLLFLQYNRMIFAPIMAYVSPGGNDGAEISEVDPTVSVAISDDARLLIPKLNIDVPVHFGISNDTATVMAAMNNGVAQFSIPGASAMPGEIGNLAISGHSAGDIYSNNQYKFIFSGLERLENGDLIYIDYNGVRYTYKVVGKDTVDPSDVQSLVLSTDKPMLTLITCWPLGVSTYRLLVRAEQINPAPSGETQTVIDEGETASGSSAEVMPDNEPTFFERIWKFLTGAS